jgi:hypothetical protein
MSRFVFLLTGVWYGGGGIPSWSSVLEGLLERLGGQRLGGFVASCNRCVLPIVLVAFTLRNVNNNARKPQAGNEICDSGRNRNNVTT